MTEKFLVESMIENIENSNRSNVVDIKQAEQKKDGRLIISNFITLEIELLSFQQRAILCKNSMTKRIFEYVTPRALK